MILSLQITQYRLAQHYLRKLQKAEIATRRGRQNRIHWLNVMQQDYILNARVAAGLPAQLAH